MKMIMHKTNVKLPNAPIVRPMIEINRFNVGHDFANLNTRSYLDAFSLKEKVWEKFLE